MPTKPTMLTPSTILTKPTMRTKRTHSAQPNKSTVPVMPTNFDCNANEYYKQHLNYSFVAGLTSHSTCKRVLIR